LKNIKIPAFIAFVLLGWVIISIFLGVRYSGFSVKREALPMRIAETPELKIVGNGTVKLDISNASEGYVAVKYMGDNHKVKATVEKGDLRNIYDIEADKYGKYVVLPLPAGNGDYTVAVYENLYDVMYREVFKNMAEAIMEDELTPFLYPSLYVDYTNSGLAAEIAGEIAKCARSDSDVIEGIYRYLKREVKYDYEMEKILTGSIKSPYIADIDGILTRKSGICIDFATTMAAMLRSQGIPARVVVGFVEEADGEIRDHAWVNVYLRGNERVIQGDSPGWTVVDPTYGATDEWPTGFKPRHTLYFPKYFY